MRAFAALAVALALALVAAPEARAQQRLGYVDSEVILQQLPEFQTVRQTVDRLAAEWQAELQGMQREVEALEQEYAAREVLFTAEERDRRRADLAARRTEMDAYRQRRFGPEGDLFREQQQQLRPIQERILAAVETIADEGGYDFVFDRSGDYVFLFVRAQHNLTDLVLDELGVDPLRRGAGFPASGVPAGTPSGLPASPAPAIPNPGTAGPPGGGGTPPPID